jgi:hypothetical protein
MRKAAVLLCVLVAASFATQRLVALEGFTNYT